MRLFTAINFDAEVKKRLMTAVNVLKRHAVQGSFSREENLHLTLVFIGETDRADDIKRAMDNSNASRFSIRAESIGMFKRAGGDIYWLGVNPSEELNIVFDTLSKQLAGLGFDIETRPFAPHLTLGRQVVMTKGFGAKALEAAAVPIDIPVDKISLMKSERISGRLVYTEIYAKALQ